VLPPLKFGLGVFLHLLRNRRRYDILHLCAFPYFALLGARAATLCSPVRMGVDWFEVWSRGYWTQYLGMFGLVGYLIQRLCIRLTSLAFIFSRLHGERLISEGFSGRAVRLSGLFRSEGKSVAEVATHTPRNETVLYVGRHIQDKNVPMVVDAIVKAREHRSCLKGLILGDGPTRHEVLAGIQREKAGTFIEAPGFVGSDAVAKAMRNASCLVLPSLREGYGLVLIEACAVGTPVITVIGPDNAAAELVEDGVNGYAVAVAAPEAIAEAIERCIIGGERLRMSTRRWFEANADQLSSRTSVRKVLEEYSRPKAGGGECN
jgi:glycosyltransferase involved in cell wall biosynthesis